jgi:hypothetical protein
VYLAGPIAGGITACGIAFVLRGQGGDIGGLEAARGVDERVQADLATKGKV